MALATGRAGAIVFAGFLLTLSCGSGNRTANQGDRSATRVNSPRVEPYREVLVRDLDTPWGIAFLPDGRMIFTERGGRVSILEEGSRRIIGNVPTQESGEGGLLGIAVDPEFDRNRFVYVYYTRGNTNRVSRFHMRGDATMENEQTILGRIPQARIHNGGRIRFGPDGKLYITTGDAGQPQLSQDRGSLGGKILRINKDGSIPDDNPFGTAVWAYGLRNPQGIDWHPQTGALYASSHGPERLDEVNVIQRGGNYGWPQTCDEPSDRIQALRCYTEFTLAPCAIAFSGSDLFVAGLRGNQVRRLRVAGDNLEAEEEFLSGMGRIRETVMHDGWLYISTSNRDGRGRPRQGDDHIVRISLGN